MASNSLIGKIILATALSVILYYFFWISVLPFMLIEEENIIRSLFPPIEYAFAVPVGFGVFFFGGVLVFTIYHIAHINFSKFIKKTK